MKVIIVGTDRKIFEEGSAVRQRIVSYGKLFDELHIVVFGLKSLGLENKKINENIFLYPTNSKTRINYVSDGYKIAGSIIRQNGFNKKNSVISSQDPFETGLVGLLLKFKFGLAFHIQIHTDFSNKYFVFSSPLNFLRSIFSHVILPFADAVRVVSKRIGKHIHIDHEYLSVLPIYVSKKMVEKTSEIIEKEELTFISISRLEKEKDLETAIKSFAEINKFYPKTKYQIIGDGRERQKLEKLVKDLNLGDKISFLGWQDETEKFIEKADIFISSSLFEGYGMSIVEAAMLGMPLIISDAGVAGDLFKNGESALIFKQGDISGLSQMMKNLIENKDLRIKISQNARDVAMRHLIDEDTYLQNFRENLEKALEHKNSNKSIIKRNMLLRYFFAGITGAGTQILSLFMLTEFAKLYYIYSSIFAFIISISVSFLLQKLWTFKNRELNKVHHQFAKYIIVGVLGLLINTMLMFLFVDVFNIWYILAQIIAGGVIAVFNFLMYKFFIFHNNHDDNYVKNE